METTAKPRSGKVSFANQKLHGMDFSGQSLVNCDFRGTTLSEANFTGADLSYANLEGANCWGANFTDAKLYHTNFRDAVLARSIMKPRDCFCVTLTLSCDSVEGMQINDKFWYAWLMMALLMKAPDEAVANRLIDVIGAERYTRYMEVFRERTI